MLINISRAGSQVDGAELFSVVPSNWTRGSGHKLRHGMFYLNMRKKLLYCESDRALKQAAQRACGVSFSGVT